jgi:hypothetical protein
VPEAAPPIAPAAAATAAPIVEPAPEPAPAATAAPAQLAAPPPPPPAAPAYAEEGITDFGGEAHLSYASSSPGDDTQTIIALAPTVGHFFTRGVQGFGGLEVASLSVGSTSVVAYDLFGGIGAYLGGSQATFPGLRAGIGYMAVDAGSSTRSGPLFLGAFAIRAAVGTGGLLDFALSARYVSLSGDGGSSDLSIVTLGLDFGLLVFW